MTRSPSFTHRVARTWLKLYTSGLAESFADEQRTEIENDIVEHVRERDAAGWSPARIARERLGRTLRGMSSDVLWRREVLLAQQGKAAPVGLAPGVVRWLRTCWHTLVAVELAIFFMAALLHAHGFQFLGDNVLLGGGDGFGPDEQVELMVGTVIIVGLIVTLLVSAVMRAGSISIKGSNVAMITGTFPAIAMVWMVTPVILMALVVVGAVGDLGRQQDNVQLRTLEPPT